MKNPFKPDRSADERDNPVEPNAAERPVERAADRAAVHDNPLVPNVTERSLERAVTNDRGAVVDRAGFDDGPGDRRGIKDSPGDIALGRPSAGATVVDRPLRTRLATGLES